MTAPTSPPNKSLLALYQYTGCPFCMMVDRVVDKLGLPVERHDILRDPNARAQLIEATGRQTVPVLKIGEGDGARWMPESRDIMQWLQEEYG
ncbi:MAG: glutaredoxin [Nannocystaceae bacterium]|nr:glutaredoxin [Nannocystaceae bacterium]